MIQMTNETKNGRANRRVQGVQIYSLLTLTLAHAILYFSV